MWPLASCMHAFWTTSDEGSTDMVFSFDTPHHAKPNATKQLSALARLVRYHILTSTTRAGSGHPTSSLSAVDLMIGLLFGGAFRYDVEHPDAPNNDRLIFSKGHASPLFYALWLAAGQLSEGDLMGYRRFGSRLEGHPTPALEYVEAATGSLGQGLSIGLGMALNAQYLDRLPYRTYVLLGDSEMTEGSQWEAIELAAHYRLDRLVGILDVNRLGQRGPTLHGHDCHAYERRLRAFGWNTSVVDGHRFDEVLQAYQRACEQTGRPTMIIARTVKGKGVPSLEDQEGWHGKPLAEDDLVDALESLGPVDSSLRGEIRAPDALSPAVFEAVPKDRTPYDKGDMVATRSAYGRALCTVAARLPNLVALDAEVSNSTKAEAFAERYPHRFFEMYIAEQNMVGAAIGLAQRGKIPFVSTFAAFFTRAFDQIRMAAYSNANIKFVGSHAGVAVGPDGPSQMGLEDFALFRSVLGSVVLQPCDANATQALVEAAAHAPGIVYLRTLRQKTPVIYDESVEFLIGGCHVLKSGPRDIATLVATGTTVHEALGAYEKLLHEDIVVRVIDAYSIKPLDTTTLLDCARETNLIITVEDHYAAGGLGEAVAGALSSSGVPVHSLAVTKRPKSGTPDELLAFAGIAEANIIDKVKELTHDPG